MGKGESLFASMGGRQIRSASTSPLDDDELRELFEQADLNGDGALDDRECTGLCDAIRMFHGLRTPLTEEFYAIVLDELDPDETGRIYLDDLKELYQAVWDERRVAVLNPEAPSPDIADEEEARAREALEALVAELPPATPAGATSIRSSLQRQSSVENVTVEVTGDEMSNEGVVEECVEVEGDSARKTLWSVETDEELEREESDNLVNEEAVVDVVHGSSLVECEGETNVVGGSSCGECEGDVEDTEERVVVEEQLSDDGIANGDASKAEEETSSKEEAKKLPSCRVTCGRRTSNYRGLLNGGEEVVAKPYKISGDVPISFFTSQYNTHPWVFGQYDSPFPPQAYVSYQLMSSYDVSRNSSPNDL
ncbi:hypothetical protein FOL47_005913 [Perkinsus chesapeaki]|uniref:EF-hand domain-containing protein n=1 Tax=Perkinsus chesapeaki TaxID=330153 RepID=A0A7J6LUZ0_PERCH|nr:hypothetical protein FOL47_005913 [Perkinsus chesapeaki]